MVTVSLQAESLQRRADEAREEMEMQQGSGTWRAFQNVMAMLSQADALDGESIFQASQQASRAGKKVVAGGREAQGSRTEAEGARADAGSRRVQLLPLGEVARQINGSNELWLATVLTSPELQARQSIACCHCQRHCMILVVLVCVCSKV